MLPGGTYRLVCDRCAASIADGHRNCGECGSDYCLDCCAEMRLLPHYRARAEHRPALARWERAAAQRDRPVASAQWAGGLRHLTRRLEDSDGGGLHEQRLSRAILARTQARLLKHLHHGQRHQRQRCSILQRHARRSPSKAAGGSGGQTSERAPRRPDQR